MVGDIVGYCQLKADVDCTFAMGEAKDWQGQLLRVLEFNSQGDILVLNQKAIGMAMFKKEDMVRSFKCKVVGDIICPPGLDIMAEMSYTGMAHIRKGGYDKIIKNMVIAASLSKGEFHDSFLWEKQDVTNI